jgi:ubiquinone/menaquinone biosynthesis C-methylase UbiE
MPGTAPFDTHHGRYDEWFTQHRAAYHSELLALRALVPWHGLGLEIGVGTGRFAAPLGVQIGIDPSAAMLKYAVDRGIICVQGRAEALPLKDESFDHALIVTTICFVEDAEAALMESRRVLKPSGHLVMGFIDEAGPLGRLYLEKQDQNVFYREAKFFSGPQVEKLLSDAGFSHHVWGQTLRKALDDTQDIEALRSGRGQGSFLVVRATRSEGALLSPLSR